ncbi:HAD family hydrolase [Phytoactinopolyspora mesophila]|uniref:HAD-IA family hydrolase n=1 Tax=Phytoactinopolyspora mesophila TaxID=2650750 RepID=A0A7K3MCV8_9ACTN|nr:HAD-IA family hydrolase [Phytoactinopolyspora mesophila]
MSLTDAPLDALLSRSRCVLLDFDGPVCSVFAAVDTAKLADELRRLLPAAPPPEIAASTDPMAVLYHAQTIDHATARKIEAALTTAEHDAIALARPTVGAVETIHAAVHTGRRAGIVSNNAETAIRVYLDAHKLSPHIDVVAARTPENAARLKPWPDLLFAALAQLDAEPSTTVFVGDSPSDVMAAHAAGVAAIGYANKPGKRERLSSQDPARVIVSMDDLAIALRRDHAT